MLKENLVHRSRRLTLFTLLVRKDLKEIGVAGIVCTILISIKEEITRIT